VGAASQPGGDHLAVSCIEAPPLEVASGAGPAEPLMVPPPLPHCQLQSTPTEPADETMTVGDFLDIRAIDRLKSILAIMGLITLVQRFALAPRRKNDLNRP
jgi:hypothetical protein